MWVPVQVALKSEAEDFRAFTVSSDFPGRWAFLARLADLTGLLLDFLVAMFVSSLVASDFCGR